MKVHNKDICRDKVDWVLLGAWMEVKEKGSNLKLMTGAVAYNYNPSCLGGRDLEDHSSKPTLAKSS
jgi:hypothetical protein